MFLNDHFHFCYQICTYFYTTLKSSRIFHPNYIQPKGAFAWDMTNWYSHPPSFKNCTKSLSSHSRFQSPFLVYPSVLCSENFLIDHFHQILHSRWWETPHAGTTLKWWRIFLHQQTPLPLVVSLLVGCFHN